MWTVPTQPLRVPPELGIDHFAAFPMELVRRIVRGWSPSGICVECGEGRRPVVERHDEHVDRALAAVRAQERVDATGGVVSGGTKRSTLGNTVGRTVTGESCACPTPDAPTRPSVVLDPFGGTGTTALVASALGRHGISVDRSADYCRLARWRTTDPGQRAAAMQVEKPPQQLDGQLGLFGGAA